MLAIINGCRAYRIYPGRICPESCNSKRIYAHPLPVFYPNQNKNKGFGSILIDHCIEDARENHFKGVAVVANKGAFMANSTIVSIR